MKKEIITFMVTMLLAIPMAHAKMDNMRGARDGGDRMEKKIQAMFEQLNLSDEQKNLIEANKIKSKAAKKEMRDAIRANMKAMGEELKKTELDMVKLNALHETQKKLSNQMSDHRFESILSVRKILTKEQFEKFVQMLEEKRERRLLLKDKE